MPLPHPRLNGGDPESEKTFVHRCMQSDVIHSDYPKNEQALAVCFSLYRQAVKKKRAKGSAANPTWDEAADEIEQKGVIQTEDELRIVKLPKTQ